MNIARRGLGAASTIAVAATLLAAGPRPVSLGEPATGEPDIAAVLRDNAPRGAHELSAFVYDGGEVRFGGLGADESSEMEIGSVTKTFNAELLRQAVEEGTLSPDTTVGELLDVPGAAIENVRLEELVNHTAGLDTMESLTQPELLLSNFRDGGNAYRRDTPEDILAAAGTATLEKRGEYHYSNYSQALLGQLLAQQAGTSYEELVRTRIFEPAGMDSTYLALPGTVDGAPRGLGTNGRAAEPWDMNGWAPAGAIRSTASDMARYVGWVADHGRPDYGWLKHEVDGTEYPFHNGGTEGFHTMLVWDPAGRRASFVGNSSSESVDELGVALLNATKEKEQ
ncbi:serine hydrolase [uncultured Corynebacterium sp.]|uniref:serine hydrolase domain-containing protein n=1 Tax=uncultured Corynebacterium sp. TaxID=159447 RepID=UPI0025920117|nr:serine hydrolase domain-containing protein [uncultured Corynebacterium sp.]